MVVKYSRGSIEESGVDPKKMREAFIIAHKGLHKAVQEIQELDSDPTYQINAVVKSFMGITIAHCMAARMDCDDVRMLFDDIKSEALDQYIRLEDMNPAHELVKMMMNDEVGLKDLEKIFDKGSK